MKIGLLIIATNKYIQFLQPLISSADNFFLNNQDVTYYIFTDRDIQIETSRKLCIINTEHKDWPWMTLGRYKIFTENYKELSKMDYIYYCDVDMKFVSDVGNEIISDRVVTIHPGFLGGRGTPEHRIESTAYIAPDENMTYYAGGFNGGSSEKFLEMSTILAERINQDLSRNIIAIWHDESHLNRYMVDNPPTKILDNSYCCIENEYPECGRKLLALIKKHNEVR